MGDVIVVGGGVIGLSIAYELSRRNRSIRIVDQGPIGREASWAGAGILPPANPHTAIHPYDQLRGLSYELHRDWSRRLLVETGMDTGLRVCGGIYLARSLGEAASLQAMASELATLEIPCRRLTEHELVATEPALASFARSNLFRAAYQLPTEAQIRNPYLLKALIAACERQGVELLPGHEVTRFELRGGRLIRLWCGDRSFQADQYCLTAGAWTYRLLQQLGIATGILPIRGQMVLYKCESPPFRHVLNDGPRYLVPRDDGHVLVGSTEEEAGFDKSTTEEGLRDLMGFAYSLVPKLSPDRKANSWAGLRPGTYDGWPYLGAVPGVSNAYVAAGHFRSGLYLSPATAVVISDLMTGHPPPLDLSPFSPGRG